MGSPHVELQKKWKRVADEFASSIAVPQTAQEVFRPQPPPALEQRFSLVLRKALEPNKAAVDTAAKADSSPSFNRASDRVHLKSKDEQRGHEVSANHRQAIVAHNEAQPKVAASPDDTAKSTTLPGGSQVRSSDGNALSADATASADQSPSPVTPTVDEVTSLLLDSATSPAPDVGDSLPTSFLRPPSFSAADNAVAAVLPGKVAADASHPLLETLAQLVSEVANTSVSAGLAATTGNANTGSEQDGSRALLQSLVAATQPARDANRSPQSLEFDLSAAASGEQLSPIAVAPAGTTAGTLSSADANRPSLPPVAAGLSAAQREAAGNPPSAPSRFSLELESADLGRVRVDVRNQGGVRAHLVSSNLSTYERISADLPHVTRALVDAGVDLAEFSLSRDPGQGPRDDARSQNEHRQPERYEQPPDPMPATAARPRSLTRLDLLA